MLKPDWTVQKAIKDRVDLEDMVAWAERPEEPFKIVEPLPKTAPPSKTFLHVLLSNALP